MKSLRYYLMPILKVLLFAVFTFLCIIPFSLLNEINFEKLDFIYPLVFEILSQIVSVLIVLGGLLLTFRVFKKYNFNHIFIVKKKIWLGFAKGTAIGFGLIMACGILALLNGNVSFSWGNVSVLMVLGYILLYILVAIFEEFIFRSFPLTVFSERYPIGVSILITSLLFALAHYGNPGFNWMAMLNITLAGILFSIYILQKRNIYWAVGIHFGWNFTQGILLGYKVSGTEPLGILIAKPVGSNYLSGGNFGIESSLICTILMIALIIYLLISYKIEPVEEILEIQKIEEEV